MYEITTLTTHDSTPLTSNALRDVGHLLLLTLDRDSRTYAESPPEAMLGHLLRVITHATGLEVLTRERFTLGDPPGVGVEVDLVLRQPPTGAVGIVEVDSFSFHGRTPLDFEEDIRRDRLLRRNFVNVERFAAAEIQRNPWGTVREVLSLVNGQWSGFRRVEIAPGLRALLDACADEGPGSAEGGTPPHRVEQPVSILDRIRAHTARLPLPMPIPNSAARPDRRAAARAYETWSAEESELLLQAFRAGADFDDVAEAMGRTRGAIWARLRRIGVVEA